MEDNYDDMSNDQLRLKLLEYGFNNMPVTSTTRKVLIKKLRNHISDTAKLRRETIHVAKYSSDDDSEPLDNVASGKKLQTKKEATNRRATIAGASTKISKAASSSQPGSKGAAVAAIGDAVSAVQPADSGSTSKRRSGRVTPVKGKSTIDAKPTTVPPQEAVIMEDSDDDMVPLTQLKQRDRKSKSPSLSRTDMLTTSYIHQIEISKAPQIESIVEEMEVDLPEPTQEPYLETIVLDDYDDVEQDQMPPPRQPSPKPKPVVKETVHSKTTHQFDFRRTLAAPEAKSKDVSALSGIATPSRNSTASALKDNAGSRYVPTDSPYLSEFTKRLSRLRAEAVQLPSNAGTRDSPSRKGMMQQESKRVDIRASTRSAYDSKDEASTSRFRVANRQTYAMHSSEPMPLHSTTEGIRTSMRQSLLALDRKYSIKKKFYCVLIFLLVVFLFVFFFM
ncbi:AGAP007603-PA-like protein [Anopheles sinensis]|uniref:AGAP007603-PA-like protein n=1 Tax=Anopheles sinensis TaxID=74873 RepID=A0A084VWY4_ANOSI|nr:AGAP007603-PA-like protein [Anopheles sinensis]